MTGLQALSGLPLALVRSILEVMVVLAGFALGGTVGLATLFLPSASVRRSHSVSACYRISPSSLNNSGLGAFGIFHKLCVHHDIFILRNKGRYHHFHAIIQNRRFETIRRCLTFNHRFCFSHLAHHFLR